MLLHRPACSRGLHGHGGIRHASSFSCGDYHDPQWMGFGALRVLNEDHYAPAAGAMPHRRANMELVAVVLSGRLACTDAEGNEQVLPAGGVWWASAGHGAVHGSRNPDAQQNAHVLQAWLQPDRLNALPASAFARFDPQAGRGRWATLLSPDGAGTSLPIRQRAWLRATRLEAGDTLELGLDAARRYWLQVTAGEVHAAGHRLSAGDGLGLEREGATLALRGIAGHSDVLLFDLPG